MIQIKTDEAKYILTNTKRSRLKKASERKRSGGHTYYVLCDDRVSLALLAKLRGYEPKKDELGVVISPVTQLLADN